jgi:hypothetical protein
MKDSIVNEPGEKKLYRAIFWTPDPAVAGKRVEVYAMNVHDARRLLETEYGSENTYSIWNDEEASQPR